MPELSLGDIAGICAGGALVLIALISAFMYRCGWYARQKEEEMEEAAAMPSARPSVSVLQGTSSNDGGLMIEPYRSPGSQNFYRGK